MLLFLNYLRHSRLGQSGWKQDEKTARHVSRTLQSVSEASQGLRRDSVIGCSGIGYCVGARRGGSPSHITEVGFRQMAGCRAEGFPRRFELCHAVGFQADGTTVERQLGRDLDVREDVSARLHVGQDDVH